MSEFDLNTRKTNFSQNQTRNPSQGLKDQAADAGAEMKQRAGDALRASTDVARDKFKEAAGAAKDVAAGAADRFQERRAKNSARVRISSAGSLAISGMQRARSRTTHRLRRAASILRPNMSTRPPTRSATEASAMSSTERPISRSGSRRLFLGYRC